MEKPEPVELETHQVPFEGWNWAVVTAVYVEVSYLMRRPARRGAEGGHPVFAETTVTSSRWF